MRAEQPETGPFLRFGIAFAASLIAFVATYVTWPLLKPTPWAFCFAAVMASAWFGGQGPSLVATVVLAVVGHAFFIERGSIDRPGGSGLVPTLVFLLVSLFIGLLASARRRAEAFERAERRRFQATVTSIGDGVIATDNAGRVTFMNQVAEELTGWNAREARGRPLEEVFVIVNENTGESTPNPVDKVLETGRIQGLANHTVLIARDGTGRPIDDSAAPIKNDRGLVAGVVLVFHDVTENRAAARALAESEEFNRRVIESSTDCLKVLDLDGRLLSINDFGCRLMEIDDLALCLMQVWVEFWPEDSREAARGALEEAKEGKVASFHGFCPTAKGNGKWWDVILSPIFDAEGKPLRLLVVSRDVTEAKRAEAEMLRLREEERAAEKRADRILESVTDAFFAVDREWRFTYLNPRAALQLRRDRDELLGKVLWDEFPNAVGTKFEREYRTAVDECRVLTFEEYHPAPLNTWFEVHAYPSEDGLSVYFRDVNDRKRAQEEIRSKTERVNLLVENIKDYAVLISDPRGRIVEWQGGAERITGYTAHEAVGQTVHLIFTPEDRADGVPEKELIKAAQAGRAEDKRWHQRKDGSRFFADGVMTPIYDDGGELRGFGKVFKDATREKQAAEATRTRAFQLQKLAEIAARINSAHDVNSVLGVVTEEARELLGANQAATSMMVNPHHPQPLNVLRTSEKHRDGSPAPSIEGLDFYEAASEANEPLRLTRGELDADPRWRASGRFGDGISTVNGWLAAPLMGRNGKSMGLLQLSDKHEGEFTFDDEAILVQLTQLAAIAIENARLYQELRSNDERKDEFLAMLAHELRNPLAAIGNAVKLSSKTDVKEQIDWSKEVIERQMQHLSRLIDDLMDVSRITRGKIVLRRDVMEATSILESAAATVMTLVDERKHTLDIDIDRGNLWLNVDPTRLEQVVVNLLNNAAKYSENVGHIWLSARNEGGEVVIKVKDEGVGVPPEKLLGMFELFAQGDRSLARSEGGLGIGLTVVKKLVEMHGGTITAKSEGLGKGSEFAIRLPAVAQPSVGRSTTEKATAQPGKKSRILVVDDNVDTARGMARLLKLIGHEVATAHSGHVAIEVAQTFRPEFVLLDIGLPGMSGYEVASKLRREVCGNDAVIVAVSGYGQDEDRRRSKEAGFDFHLTKPVDHDALLALLSSEGIARP